MFRYMEDVKCKKKKIYLDLQLQFCLCIFTNAPQLSKRFVHKLLLSNLNI